MPHHNPANAPHLSLTQETEPSTTAAPQRALGSQTGAKSQNDALNSLVALLRSGTGQITRWVTGGTIIPCIAFPLRQLGEVSETEALGAVRTMYKFGWTMERDAWIWYGRLTGDPDTEVELCVSLLRAHGVLA